MHIVIQGDFTTVQTGVGYQFYGTEGLLGDRIEDGISSPQPGLYVATATVPAGAIGVQWTSDSETAREDLKQRLTIEQLAAGGVSSGAGAEALGLADFYEPLRVLLKDNDVHQQENSDAMLASALRSAWRMGLWPAGYVLDAGFVTPEVPVGKDFAGIVIETALFMMVGDIGAYSFATRPLSETDHGDRKRDIIQYCRIKMYELRDGDACFSSRQSLIAFFNTMVDAADLATVNVIAPLNFAVDYQGSGNAVSLTPPI